MAGDATEAERPLNARLTELKVILGMQEEQLSVERGQLSEGRLLLERRQASKMRGDYDETNADPVDDESLGLALYKCSEAVSKELNEQKQIRKQIENIKMSSRTAIQTKIDEAKHRVEEEISDMKGILFGDTEVRVRIRVSVRVRIRVRDEWDLVRGHRGDLIRGDSSITLALTLTLSLTEAYRTLTKEVSTLIKATEEMEEQARSANDNWHEMRDAIPALKKQMHFAVEVILTLTITLTLTLIGLCSGAIARGSMN